MLLTIDMWNVPSPAALVAGIALLSLTCARKSKQGCVLQTTCEIYRRTPLNSVSYLSDIVFRSCGTCEFEPN